MNPAMVIAETIGDDIEGVKAYQYFNFQQEDPRAFFWIDDTLWCVGQKAPKLGGFEWTQAPYQGAAQRKGTIVWMGKETPQEADLSPTVATVAHYSDMVSFTVDRKAAAEYFTVEEGEVEERLEGWMEDQLAALAEKIGVRS